MRAATAALKRNGRLLRFPERQGVAEIKPGTLVIKPIRESALVLPSRDGPLQCGQAMISAVLIDIDQVKRKGKRADDERRWQR